MKCNFELSFLFLLIMLHIFKITYKLPTQFCTSVTSHVTIEPTVEAGRVR